MGISYLDIEDEITTAVGRLRASDDARVALVLPPGSRIATSRINFRLLAREAREHDRLLAIVTPEASVRAVAVSAGLPAYAAVSEYEAAVADGAVAQPTETTAPPGTGAVATAAGSSPTTAVAEALAAGGVEAALERTRSLPALDVPAGRSVTAAPDAPSIGERLGDRLRLPDLPVRGSSARASGARSARPWIVAIVGLIVVLGVLGFGLYTFLPSASITITPIGQSIGPVALTVVADPAATTIDATRLVVPARTVTFQLSANDTFPTTGVKVSETKATGTVTFQNYDPSKKGAVFIPAGSIVSTPNGIQFATQASLTVARAPLGGTSQASIGVQAVVAGTGGNVVATSITVVPPNLNTGALLVTNAEPTTGGTHSETKIVAQADYDNAVKALTARLQTQLRDDLADPTQAPAGSTIFPTTAKMGTPTPDTTADKVVGTALASLPLTLSATATATAVDQSQLAPLAETRLKAQVPSGYQLFADSIQSTVGAGTVDGSTVSFPVEARAQMWKPVDPANLLDGIKGRTVAQARAALAPLGQVAISVWPSWVSTITSLDQRLSLTIEAPRRPTSTATPAPTGGATSVPSGSSAASPTASSAP